MFDSSHEHERPVAIADNSSQTYRDRHGCPGGGHGGKLWRSAGFHPICDSCQCADGKGGNAHDSEPELGSLSFDALVAGNPEEARNGRLVLFLHGFPETAESFRKMLPLVVRAGYYAVAYSQRGYSPGARQSAVSAYNILDLVGDVTAIAASLGAPSFHLVGHDWG